MRELFVHPGIYKGAVINVRWAQIEPKQGVFDFSAIDEGLRTIAKYNAEHPSTPVAGKLRVFAGMNVPVWLMPLSRGPLEFEHNGQVIRIAGWWTPEYRREWKALQDALAAKYDADPLMGEVAASSCSTVTAESFIFPHGPVAIKTLKSAGFTDAAEKACLMGAVDDFAAWKLTPLDIAFSPYFAIDSGRPVRDDPFSLSVMKFWRSRLAERGIISNHSVQDPIADGLKLVYAQLKEVGPPIELQTASQGVIQNGKVHNGQPGPSRPKNLPPFMDWNKVIQNALDTGAGEIELWTTVEAGGQARITTEMLQSWANKLK